jgi:hypothetical protein
MLGRIKMSKEMMGRQDSLALVGLFELAETKSTFIQMFKSNKPFYDSFNRMLEKKFGWAKHLALLSTDGCAMGNHKGNSGHAGTMGCCFCTRPKSLKHVSHWLVTNLALLEAMGVPRTYALNKATMAKFELATKAHMQAEKVKYAAADPDFDLEKWLQPNQLHLPHHPAIEFLKTWSRDHGYNYRCLQIYEQLPDDHFMFDP